MEGVLDTEEPENKNTEKAYYSRVTLRFASERHLKKFLRLLPELKVQSKVLWAEANHPEEFIA